MRMIPLGLVICDLESTQIHGMELVRQWKARQPETPFLALTNGGDVGSAVEAMKNGVADCLVKPIDQDDVRSSAMQLIDAHREQASKGNGIRPNLRGSRTLIFRRELRSRIWSGRRWNRRSCSTMGIAHMQRRPLGFRSEHCSGSLRLGGCRLCRFPTQDQAMDS